MGNAYRSTYTTREFKMRYERAKFGGIHPTRKSATRNFSSLNICLGALGDRTEGDEQNEAISPRKCAVASPVGDGSTKAMDAGGYGRKRPLDFEYPFNELMLWAVLTRRHEMANLFWQYSEEPMAKALVAIRLYKCMSREAAHDYTEVEVSNQLRECANTFRDCSLELLHNCHQQDSQLTMRLLTAELPNWGHHTCLSLAVIANNKRFLAHPCCQILLAELWHGGLRFRSQSNVKVVLGILFPPSILLLDFKTTSFGNRPPLADTSNKELDEQVEGDGDSASSDQQQEDEDEADEGGAEEELTKGRRCWEEAEERCGGEQRRHFVRCHCFGGYRGTQTQSELIAPFRRPPSPITSVLSKFVLFYGAPITSFWIWFISYVTFMLALIFVLLVEFPTDKVPPIEWFLFIYVLSLAMEHFRKLFVLESSSLLEKLSVFYNRYWNILTTVRTILASNSVLWHMKLFDFLGVHPRIGPYITMAGKMVLAMSYIVVLLMVTLMAFGVGLCLSVETLSTDQSFFPIYLANPSLSRTRNGPGSWEFL
uniref:Ion_trans domain-containing protein n=1 Tax=Globodera pallida TaxID=36090 RepID=A0A183BQX0_GLOPA